MDVITQFSKEYSFIKNRNKKCRRIEYIMKEIDIMEGGAMGEYTKKILDNFKNSSVTNYEKTGIIDERKRYDVNGEPVKIDKETLQKLFAIRFIFSVKFLNGFRTLPGIEIPAFLKEYYSAEGKPDWSKLLDFLKLTPNELLKKEGVYKIITDFESKLLGDEYESKIQKIINEKKAIDEENTIAFFKLILFSDIENARKDSFGYSIIRERIIDFKINPYIHKYFFKIIYPILNSQKYKNNKLQNFKKGLVELNEERLEVEAEQNGLAVEAEQNRLAVEAEQNRLAVEAEEKRVAEQNRLAALEVEKRVAEQNRLAAEEEKRLTAEEEKRLTAEEEKKVAEQKRVAEEKKVAEQNRLAVEAEEKRVAEQNRLAALEVEKERLVEEEKRVAAEEEKRVAESNADIILNALKILFTFTPIISSATSSTLSSTSSLVRGKFVIKEDDKRKLHFEEIDKDNIPEIKNLDECNVSDYVFSFDEQYFMEVKESKPVFYVEKIIQTI